MGKVEEILEQIKQNQKDVRFSDLCLICDHYFGRPRQNRGSHRVYQTPWPGDPRVTIQNKKGKAKTYQVQQVLKAIERLESNYGD